MKGRTLKYKDKYIAINGEEYACSILKEYAGFVDVEINPEIEETTFFKVRKHMVVKGV